MTRALLLFAALAMMASCGIKRPLLRPKDIPAYEQKREEKLKKRQIETPGTPQAMLQQQGAA